IDDTLTEADESVILSASSTDPIITAGDSGTGTIVDDDAVTAMDDTATATETGREFIATEDESDDGQSAQGNVLSNDSGTGLSVTSVTFNNQIYPIPVDGSTVTINTTYGDLTIDKSGQYTFTVDEAAADSLNVGDQQAVPFTYTVEDGNGNTASAGLTITVEGRDDAPEIVFVSENDQPYHHVDGLLDTDHDGTPDTLTPDALINQNNPDLRFNEDNGNIRIDMGNGNSSMAVNYWGGTAGYLNVIGFYEKDENGNIVDTKIIHSDNDPGFDYYSNPINLGTLNDLSHEVGFFIIPNGYSDNNEDIKQAIDNGWQPQIDTSTGKITFVNPNDSSETVEVSKVYYTDNSLSTDGRDHAIIGVNDDGSLTIGFEDLPENSTDQDYDDVVLTISACQTLDEGNHIFTSVDLNDVDNANLQSATLTITNAQPEDTVAAASLPGGITLNSTYNNGQLQVTLSGSASVEDYEAALQALTFESSSSDRTPRDIELQVFDGTKHSNVSAFTLDIGGCSLNTYDDYPDDNPQDDNSVIANDDYGLSEQGEVILETGGGLAGKPDVAALEDGGYVIAWTEQDPNNDYQHDVYLQRFDVNGEPVTSPQLVNTFTEGDQYDVNVTSLTGGRYLVTWTANDLMKLQGLDDDDGGSKYIQGQIFDENGQPVCHEFTVARAGYDPIIGLPDGGFVVSWTANAAYDNAIFNPNQNPIVSDAHDGDGLGIVAQRFDAYGNPVGDRVIVNTTTAGDQLDSDIVLLADGSAIMTWQSVASDGDMEIMAQKLVLDDNAGLVKSGEEITVSSNDHHDQTNPSITALPNGSAVIAWQSDDRHEAIAFRMVNADGTLGDEVVVSTHRHAENPVITAGENGFVIAWEEGNKLLTQSFNAQGQPNGDPVVIEHDDNPAIATLADGSYVVAHESAGGHIAYQRFNADGTPFEKTSFALDEDSSITLNVSDLLANDSDPQGDSFSIQSVSNPQHGTVTLSDDHTTVTFTPDPDYNGPATFDYTILDERGATDTATVHLLVKPQGEPTVFVGTTCDADIHGTNVVVNEGEDVIFGVRLSGVEPGSTVTLALSDGTAIDSDYHETTFQYSFDGTNWHDVTGPIEVPEGARGFYVKTDTVDDTQEEADETFNLTATLSTGQSATGTATILDNDGETSENTAPTTTDDTVITCEDNAYTFTLNDFGQFSDADSDSLAAVKIKSLPENGQLLLNGQAVTADTEISATDIQAGKLVFNPTHNTDADSSFAFRVSDGTDWSDQHSVTIDVKAVADTPDVNIDITPVSGSETIDVNNVTTQGSGFTVKAFHQDDSPADISIVSGTDHDGFGVKGFPDTENHGWNPGADTELSHDPEDDSSEKIEVDFDHPVNSMAVSFAWMHSGEHAQIDFYRNGQKIDTQTVQGQTDTVDGPFTFTASDGTPFDKVVFSAPGEGDDYLIHSIQVDEGYQTYKVDLSAAVTDTDGSEHLSSVTISNIPAGAQLFDAQGNAVTVTNGTANVPLPNGAQSLQDTWTLKVPDNTGDFALNLTAVSAEGATGNDVCELHQTASAEDSAQISHDGGQSQNHAPTTTDDSVMTQEDTPLVLSLNDFGQFSDADGDQLAAVKIESLPTNGQLLLNGQAVTAGTEISAADIQAGKLVFNPTHNTDADSSFQFSVSDGTDWSSAHTVAVNVKAVADTPDVSITVGTPTVISQDGQNNGWGNGDQNSPGKSSGHNAAENGVWFANGQWHLNLPGYSEHNPGDLGRNQTIDLSGGKDRLIVQDTYGGSNIHAKGGNDVIEIRGHIRGNTSLDGGNGHDILLLGQPKDHYTIHNLTNNNGLIACQIKDNQTNQVLTVNNIEGIGFGDGHVLGNGFGSESHESSDETLSYPVTVTAALNDTDGSESLSVRLTGIPENAQLKLTNADASDYVLTHTASGWLLTPVDPSATQVDAQLTLTVPSNTPQFTIKA
ncbi:tandem-95 repeat protein, partial [Candidatus Parcubacteria bacterium]